MLYAHYDSAMWSEVRKIMQSGTAVADYMQNIPQTERNAKRMHVEYV